MEHNLTDDLGGRLRRAREHRGMSLREASRRTKLTIAVLQAIERNDFASLPGDMFRKAYVRTLAVEVGLDANEMAAEYRARFERAIDTVAVPDHDAALQQKWLQQLTPSPRRSIVALAALAAAAAAWFMLQPALVAPKVPLDDTAHEFAAVAAPHRAAIGLTTDRPDDATMPTAIASQATTVPLRIEMVARGWCWVAAESDGERVMYRLMEPGERLVLEGQHMISLRLGDAGAVTVSINDGARRLPGRHGEVVELEVTRDNVRGLRDVAAATVS